MKTLKLADALLLPADEAVTQKYGFIGRSGSGKSYAAMRLAELFLGAGAQIIALDWVGIWWSLRLTASGKAPGFEHVYIFGGEHADVELRPESGALMADLVVDKHISVVLDVMHFRKAERTRFATAFAEQFFHRKKTARTACHLFIEEAQAYLPQMVRGEEARMVGVFEDIGKVGRNYGIGNSLISQRPQAINKDVLNQVEVLLAFQTNGPQERKAIAGWTAENTSAGAAMMQALPSLNIGHALVWSPQWLRIAHEVHISKRETYDASSTPTGHHAKAIAPKTLAPAELEQLGEAMKATIEKAKAEDPRELRRLLVEKDKEIKRLNALPSAAKVTSVVDKPALTDAERQSIEKLRAQIADANDRLVSAMQTFRAGMQAAIQAAVEASSERLSMQAARTTETIAAILERAGLKNVLVKLDRVTVTPKTHTERPVPSRSLPAAQPGRASVATRPAARSDTNGTGDGSVKGGAFRSMLIALAQAGRPLADNQVAARAGMSLSGTFDKYLGQQRTNGWVDGPRAALALTPAGFVALGDYEPLPTGPGLQRYWLDYVGGGKKREMLATLIAAYPMTHSDETLAEQCDMALSGTFDKYLGQLRTLQLVTGTRQALRASEELF